MTETKKLTPKKPSGKKPTTPSKEQVQSTLAALEAQEQEINKLRRKVRQDKKTLLGAFGLDCNATNLAALDRARQDTDKKKMRTIAERRIKL